VRSAVAASHLRALPADTLDGLLNGAVRLRIPAGAVTHREGDPAPHLDLVIAGIVRVFVTAPDGRQMTVRYCRAGALIGAMSLFATGFAMPANTQALVDAQLLRLSPPVARAAATRDVRVARAFVDELSERALRFVYEIPGSVFATVRQRVARHLLDLASEHVPPRRRGHARSSWSPSPSASWPMRPGARGRSSCGCSATCATRASCAPDATTSSSSTPPG